MNLDNDRKRYAVYARTAVKANVGSSKLVRYRSIEGQVAVCTRYVADVSGLLVAQFSDTGAIGITLEGRPGWDAMIADARAGRFDVVVVAEPSRVARSRHAQEQALNLLGDAGVQLVFASSSDTSPDTSGGGDGGQ